jgi:mRNA (guanine-N7-)-methyltransferase
MDLLLKDKMESVSITNLLNCIESLNVKKEFLDTVGPTVMNKISKDSRKESKVYALRSFHNWIKGELITRVKNYYSNTQKNKKQYSLLDIAVGRGGDLYKWEKAGITKVTGFDISSDSISSNDPENPGAIERYKNSNVKVKVNYFVGDASDPSLKVKGEYDFVSCQFALHYFFKSEDSLRNMLKLVSKSLLPGGYFYGTTIDGNKIKSLKKLNGKLYTIKKNYKDNATIFGKEYSFLIKDTLYFDAPSTEYLVNFETLIKIAKEYSLEPEYTEFFNDFYLGSSNITSFQDLIEKYSGNELSPEEMEISRLNSIFIFKKK